MRRTVTIISLIVILAVAGFLYYRYFFVFGEGVKAGELNYIVKKGYIFKTNEGRLIQTGIRGGTQGSISSNEFMFSVTDARIANQLETAGGKIVQLHYKEYIGILPWRGVSNFVVDSVLSVSDANLNMPGTNIH
ncbi:hypothetical protein [Mucilaginibacter arboris]|uniref:6-phosphogluconate dehydrogenase n=1 Tax=Mucilaginibacter arboris TaxID=2682090 RepID=A0A7K1SXC9_9SPHI|nr:hypothetical protein [Mucilaginibacter arboris]MVN21898.1 hypothetical protein [Mucilaginibacter arboris]